MRILIFNLVFMLSIISLKAQIQKGSDIDGDTAMDFSGESICMPDANTLAVGSPKNDASGIDAGHIRIFAWNGSSWAQKGTDIHGEAAFDWSGQAMDMPDANTVAIGAYQNDGNGSSAGHVRVYSWNGSSWIQTGMDINGEAAGDKSGYSISMPNETTIAIGARENDGNGPNAGHARIYTWNSTIWMQKGMDIDGDSAEHYSGSSVSMPDANTLAIGCVPNNSVVPDPGHVRIFTWNGSAWIQKGAVITGEAINDQFGWSVNMPDNNTIAIGAPQNSGTGANAGHSRVYTWNGTQWLQKGADVDGESPNDASGFSVCMPDANTLSIGAPHNSGIGSNAGHVRIYSWNGSSWIQKGLDIEGEFIGDIFGSSVTMPDNNTVAAGAPYNDENGNESGHVRVFVFDTTTNIPEVETDFFKVYPNPTSGEFTLEMGLEINAVELIIRNEDGQELSRHSLSSKHKSTLYLPKEIGCYFLELLTKDKKKTSMRIIKN